MESNELLFTAEDLDKLLNDVRGHEREKCAERAWIALVKHGQPWNVRQDVTEAIRSGEQQ